MLYEKAGQCWMTKRAVLLFFYHVYLDTEREMREQTTFLNNIYLVSIEFPSLLGYFLIMLWVSY